MVATKGSIYCPEHLTQDKVLHYVLGNNNAVATLYLLEGQRSAMLFMMFPFMEDLVVARRRVPCPLDHTHTVFEDALPKHLRKCNAAKRLLPTCHTPLINQGLSPDDAYDHTSTLSDCSPDYLEDLIKRVESAYQSKVPIVSII